VCARKPTWATRKSRDFKFTALHHHINVELLTSSFYQLKKKAAFGVDQMTWHEYEKGLKNRINEQAAWPWDQMNRLVGRYLPQLDVVASTD